MDVNIGLSVCFFHRDPKRPLFKDKTLLYVEESLLHWIMSEGAYASMIPTIPSHSRITLRQLVSRYHGLILQGGSDVSPTSYGEDPIRPEWAGDSIRDQYEIHLVKQFIAQNKPILGICRGAQLLNVAFGGTLYQDISSQVPTALVHRNWEIYEKNYHPIVFGNNSSLQKIYPGIRMAKVNSVHHQAIKDLGKDLSVEACSERDGIIEAIRLKGNGFVLALQWHPEFHDPRDPSLLDCRPILREFLRTAGECH